MHYIARVGWNLCRSITLRKPINWEKLDGLSFSVTSRLYVETIRVTLELRNISDGHVSSSAWGHFFDALFELIEDTSDLPDDVAEACDDLYAKLKALIHSVEVCDVDKAESYNEVEKEIIKRQIPPTYEAGLLLNRILRRYRLDR